MKIPHVAVYVRVSTKDQAEEGLSMDAQPANALKKLDEEFGKGMYTYELFEDAGKSGGLGPKPWATECKRTERQGMWALIQAVKAGRFSHVVAFRSDRLYRDQLGFLGFYTEVLKPNGVKLLFVAENFDESISGQLTAGVLAGVAEWQRKQTGENIQKTLDYRRSNGFYLGLPPYGWRMETPAEHEGRMVNIRPVEELVPTVRRIKDLFLSGNSFSAVARILNDEHVPPPSGVGKWSHGSVEKILRCHVHAGLTKTDREGTLGKGVHYDHRIYDEEDFRLVQDRILRCRKRLRGPAVNQPFRLFAGLVHCGHCGAPLYSQFNQAQPSYMCFGDRQAEEASHVYVNARRLEAVVLEQLVRIALEDEVQEEAASALEALVNEQDDALRSEGARLKKALEDIESKERKVGEALASGDIPQNVARGLFAGYEKETTGVRSRLVEIEKSLGESESRLQVAKRAQSNLRDIPMLWSTMSDAEKREVLHVVIERIEAHAGEHRKWIKVYFATGHEPVELEVLAGMERYKPRKADGAEALSERELAALYHVLQGADYKKVAEHFGTSRANAHNILRRAAHKVGENDPRRAAKKIEARLIRFRSQLPLFGKVRVSFQTRRLRVGEYHVLMYAAKGETVQTTAALCGIAVERVEALLKQALAKLGASSVPEATRALEQNPHLLPIVMEHRLKGER
ncbi:MAG: recombinase family protein [Armatimonadetes bacterium]|nr:recombinase family protein [Armatimonadota bacterium]